MARRSDATLRPWLTTDAEFAVAGGEFAFSWLQGLTYTLLAAAGALVAAGVGVGLLEAHAARDGARRRRVSRALAASPCGCELAGSPGLRRRAA